MHETVTHDGTEKPQGSAAEIEIQLSVGQQLDAVKFTDAASGAHGGLVKSLDTTVKNEPQQQILNHYSSQNSVVTSTPLSQPTGKIKPQNCIAKIESEISGRQLGPDAASVIHGRRVEFLDTTIKIEPQPQILNQCNSQNPFVASTPVS